MAATLKAVPSARNMEEKFPGFWIATLFKDKHVEVARVLMFKKEIPRYPLRGTAQLNTHMMVTVLKGEVWLAKEGEVLRLCKKGEVIMIPLGTRYSWILESDIVELEPVNTPPFDDNDRKVLTK